MTQTAFPNDAERDVRKYLKQRVEALGGELRKVRWQGRNKAPDERVLLRPLFFGQGCFFVELKRPGEEPDAGQWHEIRLLRSYGERVEVITCREDVDRLLPL